MIKVTSLFCFLRHYEPHTMTSPPLEMHLQLMEVLHWQNTKVTDWLLHNCYLLVAFESYLQVAKKGYLLVAFEGYLLVAKKGYLLVAFESYLLVAFEGYLQVAKEGYLLVAFESYQQVAKEGYLQVAKEGYLYVAKEGLLQIGTKRLHIRRYIGLNPKQNIFTFIQ